MLPKGFTLIEMMIVVAIVGILSMFAVIIYIDYVKRVHVAEGIALASSAKIAAAVYSAEHGVNPPNNTAANLGLISGVAVNSIEIATDAITITYNNKAGRLGTITLTYETSSSNDKTGTGKWRCTATTLKKKWLPKACATQF